MEINNLSDTESYIQQAKEKALSLFSQDIDRALWEPHFVHHELPIIPDECILSGRRKNKKVWV